MASVRVVPESGDVVIRKILRFLSVGACAGALATAPAYAQEPTAGEGADRWKISAELSYADQSGNEALRLLTSGLRLSHLQKQSFELDLLLQSRYGENDERVIARSHYGAASFDFQPEQTWSPFLFSDAEHDPFKRLDLRFSGGAGAKYTFFRPAGSDDAASVSLALLYSYENLRAAEGAAPDPRHLARWSLRVKGSRTVQPGVTVSHVSFYQPVWDEVADYLLRTESGVKATLARRLALSVVYQLNRDARPPAAVQPNDRILKTGLIIDF